jgi:hypothetical protein
VSAFEISIVTLLVLLLIGLTLLTVITHKAILRHQVSTDAQTQLLGCLLEVEGALKAGLPAIERNTGNACDTLSQNLSAIERNTGSTSTSIGLNLPSIERNTGASQQHIADSLPTATRAITDISFLLSARIPSYHESIEIADAKRQASLDAIQETLKTLNQTMSSDAVQLRTATLSKEISRVAEELSNLRTDLSNAIKF